MNIFFDFMPRVRQVTRHPILALLIINLFLLPETVQAVVVGGTRFIYNERAKNGISIPLKNTGKTPNLIKTEILVWPEPDKSIEISDNVPFLATPPLFVLNAGKENKLRILYVGGKLPTDREALYQLSIATIPEGKAEENSLQMAVRSRFKLFYRPTELKGNPELAYTKLYWLQQNDNVIIENPSPYYVTLINLSVNNKSIPSAGMVSPFGTKVVSWCKGETHCQIKWQTLNDYGRVMPFWQKTITHKKEVGLAMQSLK